ISITKQIEGAGKPSGGGTASPNIIMMLTHGILTLLKNFPYVSEYQGWQHVLRQDIHENFLEPNHMFCGAFLTPVNSIGSYILTV
ncbi:hypothetical protein ACJX0J_033226, partial [Zea mays]